MSIHPSLALPPALAVGLPPSHAHVLSLLFASSYVSSIYISQRLFPPSSSSSSRPPSRPGTPPQSGIPPIASTDAADVRAPLPRRASEPAVGSRDHPATIKLRMKAVGVATLGSVAAVWLVVRDLGGYTMAGAIKPTLHLLGVPTSLHPSPLSLLTPLPYILAPTLLLGPLVAMALDGALPLQQSNSESTWSRIERWWREEWDLIAWRNYVVGPLTEELTFRSSLISISLLAHLPLKAIVFLTPLWFGVAHAHHALEVYRRNGGGRDAAFQAIAGGAFQLTYTTLFGWFASYLFLRTGSLLPPLVAHVYCNAMGIYLPTTAVQHHPQRKALIWASYLIGIVGFVYGMRRL